MKFSILNYQLSNGQSLFEVVVAIGIAALVLVGAVSLSTMSVRNSTFSRNDSVATKFAQEGSEYMRQQRDTDWDGFITNYVSKSQPVCLNATFSTSSCSLSTPYSRSMTFKCNYTNPVLPTPGPSISCSDSTVNVVDSYVTVSWTDGQGTHKVQDVTTLTNWR